MAKMGPDQRPGFKVIDVIEGYNKWALTYDCDPNPLIALEEPITIGLIGEVRGQEVLDIGCGTGRYCVILAERGAKVTGIDPSPIMIEKASKKLSPTCCFKLVQDTIFDVHYPSEHFDLIISALTFGHILELEPMYEEMQRILKKNGHIIISDFHPYWSVFGHGYTEFYDECGHEYRIISHPHLFEEYYRLAQEFGLSIVSLQEPAIDSKLIEQFPYLKDYIGLPLALILKLKKSIY